MKVLIRRGEPHISGIDFYYIEGGSSRQHIYYDAIDHTSGQPTANGAYTAIKSEVGEPMPPPSLRLRHDEEEFLLSMIEQCRLIMNLPSEKEYIAQLEGELIATKKHLADMRAIAYSSLDMDIPEQEKSNVKAIR